MNDDAPLPYRDPLDQVEDIETGLAPPDAAINAAAERAGLERTLTVAGKAMLDAADALLASIYVDKLDAAALLVKLTEHLTQRQSEVITRLVVDAQMSTRDVAKHLGWSPAQVAFACKARRTT